RATSDSGPTLEILRKARSSGWAHSTFLDQTAGRGTIRFRPVALRSSRSESDRSQVVVDPAALDVDPAVTESHVDQGRQVDGKGRRCLFVKPHPVLGRSFAVLFQPGLKLVRRRYQRQGL